MARHISRGALAIAALLLAACGDNGTSPLPIPHLEVSVGSISPAFITTTTSTGNPTVTCKVTFHVVSNGTDKAYLSRGMMRWYMGKDRAIPVDSSPLTGKDLQAFFGSTELPRGSTADAPFEITAGIPFGAVLDLAYVGTKYSRERHTTTRFTCGPESTPAATPPTVGVSLVTPETQILQPGDTILLHLAAASNVGLWRTLAGIAGPCETHKIFNEADAASATRDVKLVLPASCSLNAPITVTGAALDALAVETDVSVPTTRFIVDRRPPTIRAAHDLPGNFGGAGTAEFPRAGGEFFAGESMKLHYTIADNHALRALVWEIQPFGARDSLLFADDSMISSAVDIPMRAEWGSFQMRVFVRDASGNVSPVLESAPGAFVVRPAATLPTTTVIAPVGSTIDGMVYDARSDRLFVMQAGLSRMLVYSAATLALQQTIALGLVPADFDVTEGGDTLFVSSLGYSGELRMFDLTGATPRSQQIPLGLKLGGQMGGVRALANGKVLLEASEFNSTPAWRLLEIDRATLAVRDRSAEGSSALGARSYDRNVVYLTGSDASGATCSRRFDALSDSFGACAAAAPYGRMTTTTSGDAVLVGGSLFDQSFNLLRNIAFPNAAWAWRGQSVISPDGAVVYRGYEHGVVRARASDGAVLDLIPLPYPVERLAISADGSTLFAAQWPAYYNNVPPLRISRISLR
ncbi:MAG: hypothetical protein HOQ09_01375 [Gemmatimonadaceae bacterium]|nr:hypothetical protein [Gemmatimonadaceae bacterium]